jgi:transcriptional regulator with XRE-family HTH domain
MDRKKEIKEKKFVKRLNELLKNSSESIPQIANNIGLNKSTVYRYSSGETTPKIPTVETLARYFNVNPAWLSGYDVKKRSDHKKMPETIAAHLDGDELTESEIKELEKYIEYLLSKRDK